MAGYQNVDIALALSFRIAWLAKTCSAYPVALQLADLLPTDRRVEGSAKRDVSDTKRLVRIVSDVAFAKTSRGPWGRALVEQHLL
jgi:hypothetical protein